MMTTGHCGKDCVLCYHVRVEVTSNVALLFCDCIMRSGKAVDRLTFTFLVDNCIEWMTKLPPGFIHELPQHVQLYPEPDETTKVPVIDLDHFCCGAHGFSVLIETELENESSTYTLFDTGPDNKSLVRNLSALKIPIDKIDCVVVSHWHRDHTGGLLSFLNLRKPMEKLPCVVDLHPSRPLARGIAPGPGYDTVLCALPNDPTFEEIEATGAAVKKSKTGHFVAKDTVWVSGEIPRVTDFETGMLGGMRWYHQGGKGQWTKEQHIMDERYVAVDVAGKGLVIFSACSHAGIVNVVKDAISVFSRPVYMIAGGLHLAGQEFSHRVPQTVECLSRRLRPAPTYILPMHCSGFQSKLALEAAFGEGCVPAGVGIKVNVIGDQQKNKEIFLPVYC